ncbi:MAG: biotin/lipoyl-containing protein [Acidimicrobiia bacterium]
MQEIRSPVGGNVRDLPAELGTMIAEGEVVAVLESAGTDVPVTTREPGVVREIHVDLHQQVCDGDLIALIDES